MLTRCLRRTLLLLLYMQWRRWLLSLLLLRCLIVPHRVGWRSRLLVVIRVRVHVLWSGRRTSL